MTEFNIRLAQIKERLTKFETPTPLPEGYDPKCTCGTTLIPMCGPCQEVHDAISLKREVFYLSAYEDVRWLVDNYGEVANQAYEDAAVEVESLNGRAVSGLQLRAARSIRALQRVKVGA